MTFNDSWPEALKDLTLHIAGEVRSDPVTKRAYSVDASIYEIEPLAIVTPKNKRDVVKTLEIAASYDLSVIPRGAATGITGGCLGKGVILDVSKYLNNILKIDIENEYVVCEPGVIQDQLNEALAPHGYRLGPDTSTGNRATIGGMLANNAAGAHSLRFGKMVDHVLSVELALSDGSLVKLQDISEAELEAEMGTSSRLADIYKKIDHIRKHYREEIILRFPKIPRRVSGYNLDELVKPDSFNLAKLIAGSEGTLGVCTEITMCIKKVLKQTGLCVIFLEQLDNGLHGLPSMLAFNPIALELIDDRIIEMAKLSSKMKDRLDWLVGIPSAMIVAEFEAPNLEEKLSTFKEEMSRSGIGYAYQICIKPDEMQQVWDIRKAGLGLLLSKRTYSRAIAFIEDLSVPPIELPAFFTRFKDYLSSHNKTAGIYGHVGAGCLHIRPYIDLRSPEELISMQQMMLDISTMVLDHGGALSGEHGDGLIRSWLNEKMFGKNLYEAFCEVKSAFDPKGLLNPGKVVHGSSPLQNLRLDPKVTIQSIATFQDFSPEGGFSLAADLCNGNGQCRKPEGLMCPSFQATNDEFDTTRARAQALRAVINGRWKVDDFTSPEVGRVLDLCLECKGCKSECPSQVDMAKMKTEYLYQSQEKYGYSFRNRLFAHLPSLYPLIHPFASLFNFLSNTALAKLLSKVAGITPKRDFPRLAKQRFSKWSPKATAKGGEKIVLFNDTFTEFNQPQVGIAAHTVLTSLGYEVIIPPWNCCGRPFISKGFLKEAREHGEKVVDMLFAYVEQGLSIIGLEPSCILTIADDLPSIVREDYRSKAKAVAKHCFTLDAFLNTKVVDSHFPLQCNQEPIAIKVHGHCHQKALIGMKSTLDLLKSLPGVDVKEIASGCCGMAGSFGYEAEHYDISMKIGSLHLFPNIQSAGRECIIVANGFSCRSQIEHGTGHKAIHLAEFIASRLPPNPTK